MGLDAEEALAELFETDEVTADLFLPTRLYPFDVSVLSESLRMTRRLLVVEEGQGFGSVGAEIAAQVAERYGTAGISVARVAAVESPIPAARPLEAACLPGASHILAAARGLLRKGKHG